MVTQEVALLLDTSLLLDWQLHLPEIKKPTDNEITKQLVRVLDLEQKADRLTCFSEQNFRETYLWKAEFGKWARQQLTLIKQPTKALAKAIAFEDQGHFTWAALFYTKALQLKLPLRTVSRRASP